MKEITFDNIMGDYLRYLNFKLKLNTYDSNQRKIKTYILSYFKDKNIYDLTTRDYLEWQIYINEFNFSYNYKSSLHYCFTSFLDYCMLYHDLKTNVARKVGNFSNNNLEEENGNIWTINEFNQFISSVDDKVYHTLFDLFFYTGVRKGEALALKWNDIDFNNNTIKINKSITRFKRDNHNIITTPKTKKSIRTISIDNLLKNELLNLQEYYITNDINFNNNYFVFGGKKSISFTSLERNKNKYCDKSKVKRIKIHEFRHSHACLLFSNNVPINDISNRLGHSDISMTMNTYLKYLPKDEKRVINTLNQLRLN